MNLLEDAQAEKREQFNDGLVENAGSLGDLYADIRTTLLHLQFVLTDAPPGCVQDVKALLAEVRDGCDTLKSLIRIPPSINFSKAAEVSEVIELLQMQIIEPDPGSCQGLYKWCDEIDICFTGFEGLEDSEKVFLVDDVWEDMQIQVSTVNYCLEAFENLPTDEGD